MIGVKNPIPGVVYAPMARLQAYAAAGELPEIGLAEAFCRSFAANADRVAVATAEEEISYAQLDDITDRVAAALWRLGLEPLDRVLFQSANSRELLYAFVGCIKAGLIPVCTLAGHREREIGYLGSHTDARLHIVQGDDAKFDLCEFALRMRDRIPTMRHIVSLGAPQHEGIPRLMDLIAAEDPVAARQGVRAAPRDPYQVAVFQLSGGTTSVPKVIPRMSNDYLLNITRTAEWLGYRPDDVMFNPMPMIHNACMVCSWTPTLITGGSFAIASDMTPESWGALFRARRPTWIGMIRALMPRLGAMIDRGLADIASVRAVWCPDASRLVRESFGKPAYGMFGMSEGMNMYPPLDAPQEVLDWTVGGPMSPYDEIRLVEPGADTEVANGEPGELTCRGPYTFSGYYNSPDRNAEVFTADGFYRTGDLMVQREIQGRLYYAFAGRTKDVVSRGHEKINCEELEAILAAHPAVSDCAIVGMPDPILSERVCAYVVIKEDRQAPSIAELGDYLRNFGLAKFKWPERIEVVENLPLTRVGKLDKATMRKDIAEKLSRETQSTSAN